MFLFFSISHISGTYKKSARLLRFTCSSNAAVTAASCRTSYVLTELTHTRKREQVERENMRLAKYIAHSGAASRRKAEEMIISGQVRVNGELIQTPACEVDPEKDIIEVNGRQVGFEAKCYLMLNKPAGYLSTVQDPFGRPTVIDLLGTIGERLYPVGRLDLDTEGLLLLSNDGDFTNRMIHPRHKVNKIYEVLVEGQLSSEEKKKIENGIKLEDGLTAPARIKVLQQARDHTLLEIEIHEGRKRQVKRMLQAVGHPVQRLKRIGFGLLTLEGLEPGQYRLLSAAEIEGLLALANEKSGAEVNE